MGRRIALSAAALLAAVLLIVQVGPPRVTLQAQMHATLTPSPYVGQQSTSVRGLTEAEIAAFRGGQGMGLARPAEINGYPGPMHVLQLAVELGLSDEQRVAVQALFDQMKGEAVPLGEQFLNRYASLEEAFRDGSMSAELLEQQTAAIGRIEGQLRATHLKYHLLTKPLLSDEQVTTYARLRGYTEDAEPTPPHMPGGHGGHGQ